MNIVILQIVIGWILCSFVTYLILLWATADCEKITMAEALFEEDSDFNKNKGMVTFCTILFPLFYIVAICLWLGEHKDKLNPFNWILKPLLKKKYIREKVMKDI